MHNTPLPKGLLAGVRAISFDAGLTLIEPWPKVGAVYARVAARLGFDLSADQLQDRFRAVHHARREEARDSKAPSAFSSEARAREWWNGVTTGVFEDLVPDESLKPLANACFEEYAGGDCWRVYPDVFAALETLRARGYRLVVFSNWDSRLQNTLAELGLTPFFEKIFISSLIGFEKPRVEAFQYVLDDLRLSPKAMLHVGDDPAVDLQGAITAGMRSVLIHRPGSGAQPPAPHTAILRLTDLLLP